MGEKCQHEGVSIEGQNEAQTVKYILGGKGWNAREELHLPERNIGLYLKDK